MITITKNKRQYSLKYVISEIIEMSEKGSDFEKTSKLFDIFILSLIIANIVAVVIGSIPVVKIKYSSFFNYFEFFSVVIFSIEYILRLIVCTEKGKYKQINNKNTFFSNLKARLLYIISPFAIIDLLAIMPFYLPMIITFDLRFIRILRLFRILRLLKAGRYTRSIRAIGRVIQNKKIELFTTLFLMFMLILISASFMYYVENKVQPEAFSSIPVAMWWSVATLTTVGYGDVYPITMWGKFFAGVIAILGIGVVALPSGILASGLMEEFENLKEGIMDKGNFNNHILICGWNYLGKEVISNLLSADAKITGIEQIVVMADINRPEELTINDKNVVFIKANPLNKNDLIVKGCVLNSLSIIIMPDLQSPKTDAESLMVLLTLKEIKKDFHVCVQLLDSSHKEHFVNSNADEIICLEDYGSGMTVGSIISHGLTKIVTDLITFNDNSEIYKTLPIKRNYLNATFGTVSKLFFNVNCIVIAIETITGEQKINPKKETKVDKGDCLYVIAANKQIIDAVMADNFI